MQTLIYREKCFLKCKNIFRKPYIILYRTKYMTKSNPIHECGTTIKKLQYQDRINGKHTTRPTPYYYCNKCNIVIKIGLTGF